MKLYIVGAMHLSTCLFTFLIKVILNTYVDKVKMSLKNKPRKVKALAFFSSRDERINIHKTSSGSAKHT